jgi:hypothetical protein
MQDKAAEKFSMEAHCKICQRILHCLSQSRLAVSKTPETCRQSSPDWGHQIKAISFSTAYWNAFSPRSYDFKFNLIYTSPVASFCCLVPNRGWDIRQEMLQWIIRLKRKEVREIGKNTPEKHSWLEQITRNREVWNVTVCWHT